MNTSATAHNAGAARTASTYSSGAVSYYDLSNAGSQDSSVPNSYDLGSTESYDFSTIEPFTIGAAGSFDTSAADVNAPYLYDGDQSAAYSYDADPNVYLTYPSTSGTYENDALGSYPSSADNSYESGADAYDHGVAGPFDPSKVTHSYDPSTVNITSYYGQASANYYPQEPDTTEGHKDNPLARAVQAVKNMPPRYEGPPVYTEPAQRPPKEKRQYSKTRPGPAMYLGQGPHKELVPKSASSQPSPPESTYTSSPSSSSVSSSQAPLARSCEGVQADAERAAEDAARAEKARQMAARRCTPAVPIPANLLFVDPEGAVIHPPPYAPVISTPRKSSGSSRRR